MGDIFCAGPLWRESEFAWIPAPYNFRVFGACGPNATASAASSALGRIIHTADVYILMRQHNWCDASGASTIGGLHLAAQALGCKIASPGTWYGPGWNWYAWLKAQILSGNPCVVETSRGQALVDLISGKGENAVNLQYHYPATVGYNSGGYSALAKRTLPEGFWMADGDNFAGGNINANNFNAANWLQYYPVATLNAAALVAGLALAGRQTTMAWTKQADGTGKDDKGHVCGTGDMASIELLSMEGVDGLMSETYLPDKTSFLPFENGAIFYWDGHAVSNNQQAQVAVKLFDLYQQALKSGGGIPMQFQLAREAVDALTEAQKAGAQ